MTARFPRLPSCFYLFSRSFCIQRVHKLKSDRPKHGFVRLEVVSISVAASDDTTAPFDEKPERQTAHFWLCGRCADSMTLMLEPARGLRVVPVALSGTEVTSVGDVATREEEVRQTHRC